MSRRALLVDLGNTRLKWAIAGDAPWRMHASSIGSRDAASLAAGLWSELPPITSMVLVSVGERTWADALVAWAHQRWDITVHRVVPAAEEHGVRNNYHDPQRLGADRWAALIGARAEISGAACVVDCGTAVTVDALTASGEFAGGVILPGVALARRALTGGTANIAAADGNETSCLARSTADAVAAGTVYGVAGAIERIALEFEQTLDDSLSVIVTGGDADRVAAHFTRPARRVPDLVLKGLARIAATL
jgi:type III pantothenate kinase